MVSPADPDPAGLAAALAEAATLAAGLAEAGADAAATTEAAGLDPAADAGAGIEELGAGELGATPPQADNTAANTIGRVGVCSLYMNHQYRKPAHVQSPHAWLLRLMRALPLGLGGLTLLSVALLLAWDALPETFPEKAHLVLGAAPLALIAVTYLAYQILVARASAPRLFRAILLAMAFLFWAANQALGEAPLATLMNDLAIALFVIDVLLTMAVWPADKSASLV